MGFFQNIFRPRKGKSFGMQPSDRKMWQAAQATRILPHCDCLEVKDVEGRKIIRELHLHTEVQDQEGDAWKLLETLIQKAIANESREFSPGLEMAPELWRQIITLPPSIAGLKSVRKLYLYGSHLVRLQPELGAMENLENLY